MPAIAPVLRAATLVGAGDGSSLRGDHPLRRLVRRAARLERGTTTLVKVLSALFKAGAGTARGNGFDVAMQGADVRGGPLTLSLFHQFNSAGIECG